MFLAKLAESCRIARARIKLRTRMAEDDDSLTRTVLVRSDQDIKMGSLLNLGLVLQAVRKTKDFVFSHTKRARRRGR